MSGSRGARRGGSYSDFSRSYVPNGNPRWQTPSYFSQDESQHNSWIPTGNESWFFDNSGTQHYWPTDRVSGVPWNQQRPPPFTQERNREPVPPRFEQFQPPHRYPASSFNTLNMASNIPRFRERNLSYLTQTPLEELVGVTGSRQLPGVSVVHQGARTNNIVNANLKTESWKDHSKTKEKLPPQKASVPQGLQSSVNLDLTNKVKESLKQFQANRDQDAPRPSTSQAVPSTSSTISPSPQRVRESRISSTESPSTADVSTSSRPTVTTSQVERSASTSPVEEEETLDPLVTSISKEQMNRYILSMDNQQRRQLVEQPRGNIGVILNNLVQENETAKARQLSSLRFGVSPNDITDDIVGSRAEDIILADAFINQVRSLLEGVPQPTNDTGDVAIPPPSPTPPENNEEDEIQVLEPPPKEPPPCIDLDCEDRPVLSQTAPNSSETLVVNDTMQDTVAASSSNATEGPETDESTTMREADMFALPTGEPPPSVLSFMLREWQMEEKQEKERIAEIERHVEVLLKELQERQDHVTELKKKQFDALRSSHPASFSEGSDLYPLAIKFGSQASVVMGESRSVAPPSGTSQVQSLMQEFEKNGIQVAFGGSTSYEGQSKKRKRSGSQKSDQPKKRNSTSAPPPPPSDSVSEAGLTNSSLTDHKKSDAAESCPQRKTDSSVSLDTAKETAKRPKKVRTEKNSKKTGKATSPSKSSSKRAKNIATQSSADPTSVSLDNPPLPSPAAKPQSEPIVPPLPNGVVVDHVPPKNCEPRPLDSHSDNQSGKSLGATVSCQSNNSPLPPIATSSDASMPRQNKTSSLPPPAASETLRIPSTESTPPPSNKSSQPNKTAGLSPPAATACQSSQASSTEPSTLLKESSQPSKTINVLPSVSTASQTAKTISVASSHRLNESSQSNKATDHPPPATAVSHTSKKTLNGSTSAFSRENDISRPIKTVSQPTVSADTSKTRVSDSNGPSKNTPLPSESEAAKRSSTKAALSTNIPAVVEPSKPNNAPHPPAAVITDATKNPPAQSSRVVPPPSAVVAQVTQGPSSASSSNLSSVVGPKKTATTSSLAPSASEALRKSSTNSASSERAPESSRSKSSPKSSVPERSKKSSTTDSAGSSMSSSAQQSKAVSHHTSRPPSSPVVKAPPVSSSTSDVSLLVPEPTLLATDKTGEKLYYLDQHLTSVRCLFIFGPCLFTASDDGIVHIYDLISGELIMRVHGHQEPVTWLYAVSLRVSSTDLRKMTTTGDYINHLSLITGSQDGHIRQFALESGDLVHDLPCGVPVTCVAASSASGKLYVGTKSGVVFIYSPKLNSCTLANYKADVEIICLKVTKFRSRRAIIVAARRKDPVIYDLESETALLTLNCDVPNPSIYCISCSGRFIYCCDATKHVHTFDVDSNKPLYQVDTLPSPAVNTFHDGHYLILGCLDGVVRVINPLRKPPTVTMNLPGAHMKTLTCMKVAEGKIVCGNLAGEIGIRCIPDLNALNATYI